ncbi:MAG TPA: helix-turn-helix domain-containing protein, partial [Polyangiaceae bacterium]
LACPLWIHASDLDVVNAPGQPLAPPSSRRPPAQPGMRAYVRRSEQLTREALVRALAEHEGNVSRAARSLGLQRTQLYREMDRHALKRPGKTH